ncbi:MAG: type VI secretion system baseplate subunit TssG, partial [Rhodospirillales bacterium]
MAARRWRSKRTVAEVLGEEPWRFNFLQAVRVLEAERPDATPVGEGTEAVREAISFAHDAGLGFPASDVSQLLRNDDVAGRKRPAKLTQTVFGLTGNTGPLPQSFAELIHARSHKRDYALRDFLNLFVHRLVSIFVRGRKKHRVGLELKHPDQTHFADYLFCLSGLGTEGLKGRMAVPDRALLLFTALMHQKPRSSVGLEILLSQYFGTPAKVMPFLGQWMALEEDDQTVLSAKPGQGRNNALGQGAVLGGRVWCADDIFEVRLGPMSRKDFQSFLPIGKRFEALCSLVRYYSGVETDFRVRLAIEGKQAPPLRLAAKPGEGQAYLGWTTWLKARPWNRD